MATSRQPRPPTWGPAWSGGRRPKRLSTRSPGVAEGKVTLQTSTWYQMKEKKKALIFYDTTGKPVGVAGKDEKRGLQYEAWTPPGAESP